MSVLHHYHLAGDERPYITLRERTGQKSVAVTLFYVFYSVVLEVEYAGVTSQAQGLQRQYLRIREEETDERQHWRAQE